MQFALTKGWSIMSDAKLLTAEQIQDILERVRAQTPLIQAITNNVTVNLVANAILSVGATPAMVDIPVESGIFAEIASALLINVGTPNSDQLVAAPEAAAAAHKAGTPWVLDPVAVGALPVRTALAKDLLEFKPTAIRGNASEILALAGAVASGRGVDAGDSVESSQGAAIALAQTTGAVVAVSGSSDFISDGVSHAWIDNGSDFFPRITGAGCALGGVLAAFLSVAPAFEATVAAKAVYALAGELAATRASGPASFQTLFLDELSQIDVTKHRDSLSLR